MNIDFLQEPELEFGGHGRDVDIRRGLRIYGPLDYVEGKSRRIRLGFVGVSRANEGIIQWLEKCRSGIVAKVSRQPNLFPEFPGFGPESPFRAEFEIEQSAINGVSSQDIAEVISRPSEEQVIADALKLFEEKVKAVSEKDRPDVIVIAVPRELVTLDEVGEEEAVAEFNNGESEYQTRIDFRHALKAAMMKMNQPVQLVLEQTYDPNAKLLSSATGRGYKLQDEATRAWNFHTALYYKANHRPWRVPRNPTDLHTLFVGVSFYKTLDRNTLQTSVAQVYDERGEGVIVRGRPVEVSKDDRQPHLTSEDACSLLTTALKAYRSEHRHPPARAVLHKSSSYTEAEITGFQSASRTAGLEMIDMLVIGRSLSRLFRDGIYPPLRGTMLSLDKSTHLLYTRGSVPYFSTYPGMYVPRPLKFQIVQAEEGPRRLAEELLTLTKLNWNNTQFDGGEPITMRVAAQVGKVLKYVPEGGLVQPRYSFYM